MNNEAAKRIIVTIASQSTYFRGYLEGKNCWGRTGFPLEDEVELVNLSNFFTEISEALKQTKTKDEKSKPETQTL